MDIFLDALWIKIVAGVHWAETFLNFIFTPLNASGATGAVSAIALITVTITKLLSRTFTTKRHRELEKEFKYWFHIRQEALKAGNDSEKASRLAKNIDQGKLNKVYYDYFFESFMKSLATKYLPILIFLSYVNEAYRPKRLDTLFGQEYIFNIQFFGDQGIIIGAVFWFVISLLLWYILWFMAKKMLKKYASSPD